MTALALFLLALAGQAAALALVEIRRYAIYQHLADWPALAARAPWALAVLALQALVVATLAWRQRRALIAGARRLAPGWRLPALLALLGFAAVVPSADAGRTAREGILAALLMVLSGGTLLFAALAAPADALHRWRSWLGERLTLAADGPTRPWDRPFVIVVAFWVVVAAALVSVGVFERLPHIDDSVSYLFQAKVMAGGRLWVPAPPDSAAFQMDEILIDGGRWYGYGFPSWHALLAAGVLAGVPWLVNPLLAGLTVLLAHALVRRLYGMAAAHAVSALLAVSPWFLFMSGELLNHPLALVLTLAVLLAIAAGRERPRIGAALAAGAALGLLALARPLDAVLLGLVAGGWALGLGGRRLAVRDLLVIAVLAAALAALALPYNAALTGSATLAPHTAWTDRAWGPGSDRLGFGADVGIPAWRNIDPLPGHGPVDVVLNLNRNAFAAGTDAFGWGCGSLVLLALFLVAGSRRPGDRLLLALGGAFVAGYSLYWFSGGPDFGPRYWYPALPALLVLTWRGAGIAAERLGGTAAPRTALFIVLACAGALLTYVPWRIATKYHRYRDVSADARHLERQTPALRGGLVFVRTSEREDYQGPFSMNDPVLARSATIYARQRDAGHDEQVVRAFPGRPVWLLGRPHPDSARLVILQGPLPPGSVPR